MAIVTRKLEATLGPTPEISLRFGLHSGPVTAGVYVVRNHASSSLEILLIQRHAWRTTSVTRFRCRKSTADLLIAAGKGIGQSRAELVETKGKESR
jgi:hypothetical protein